MKFKIKKFNKFFKSKEYILGGDIGGTNTNLVIAGIIKNKIRLIYSLNFRTKHLQNLKTAVIKTLNYSKENYNININKACFAVAGIIKGDKAQTSNIKWNVDLKKIKKQTKLRTVSLINDFQAIGYGINIMPSRNFIKIQNGKPHLKANKAVIGAGTGLGKSTLYYDPRLEYYIPLPSEGGHQDFPAQNTQELDIVQFIKKSKKISKPVSYEMVLSGPGLETIFQFLNKDYKPTKISMLIQKSDHKSKLITKYKDQDPICKNTFKMFKMFYAKAARNYAISTLCFDGLYLAGGIAIKNPDIFDKEFKAEFCNNLNFGPMLKEIPIYLIKNYDISLYGSAFYAKLKSE